MRPPQASLERPVRQLARVSFALVLVAAELAARRRVAKALDAVLVDPARGPAAGNPLAVALGVGRGLLVVARAGNRDHLGDAAGRTPSLDAGEQTARVDAVLAPAIVVVRAIVGIRAIP